MAREQADDVVRSAGMGAVPRDVPGVVAVIRRLSVAGSRDRIVDIVTAAARELVEADGVTFVLREGAYCHYVDENAISPLWAGRRFPASACISGWCMSERKAVAIRDIYLDPRIPHDAYRPTFVRSLAMVPVRQDDPIAALGAYWSNVREVDPRELDLLQTMANCTALALAKVALEEERERAQHARLELGHRLKNMLSVVNSISYQTLKGADGPEEFVNTFSGRLQALARAQALLTRGDTMGADLRALIREQLIIDADDRIDCRGPDVFLPPDEAFDLGLVLHELGTNARKYGALSNETGNVTIEWAVGREDARPMIEMCWTERGGPPVTAPSAPGFGSALLRYALKKGGGEAHVRYDPAGVVCTMRIALR